MGNDFKLNYTKIRLLGAGLDCKVYLYRHNKSNKDYAVSIYKFKDHSPNDLY